ncbi:DegV family protein [Arthrobacter sp. H20]|uniref:DegV family protein n=1 Tax=Arthrobacter sp. H20 TaxID=1267981 RepID=UPI00047BEFD6|nr:DegV family protein [Arthrobacter sp. H20]
MLADTAVHSRAVRSYPLPISDHASPAPVKTGAAAWYSMKWLERLWARPSASRSVPEAAGLQRIAVVTDSAAALPPEWLAAGGAADGVVVVPMPVMIAGRIFGEGTDDLTRPLSVALAEGAEVRTSRPSPGQFEGVYRKLEADGATGILSVHLSGGLSGTADAARLAAAAVAIPVEVVDCRTVGMAMGFGVAAAQAGARDGLDLAGAAAVTQAVCDSSTLRFLVPSLEQLRKGGRIGAAASVLGTLLAVKPILSVQDGRILPLEKVRSATKATARLIDLVEKDIAGRPDAVVAFHYFGNETEVQELTRNLAERHPEVHTVLAQLPAVLAAHTGLGVIAIAVAGRIGDAETPSTPD